jgi:hypothetical protein
VSVRGGPTAEQFDRIEHHGTARLAQLAAQTGANRLTYVSHSLAAPDAPAADLRATLLAEEASRLVVCRTRYSGPPTSWIPCPVTSAVSAPRPRPPTSRPCTWSRQPTSPDWSPDASRFPKQPGISNDYYIRLERGKETRPSPEVIDALARALQMEPVEHEHLRSLVARGTPTPRTPTDT